MNKFKKSSCCNSKTNNYGTDKIYCCNCLNEIDESKDNKGFNSLKFILFTILLIILLFISSSIGNNSNSNQAKEVSLDELYLTKDSIISYMLQVGIIQPEIAYNQYVLESTKGTSRLAKECNNILGIIYIKQPLAIDCSNGYAVYRTKKDCILDYKRMQQYYLKWLHNRYAEDPEYINKISKI